MLFTRREIPEEVQDLAWEFYRLYFSGRSGFRRVLLLRTCILGGASGKGMEIDGGEGAEEEDRGA